MAKCVIAARGSSVSGDIRVRTRRSRPSGASMRAAARRRPTFYEREVLAHDVAVLQRLAQRSMHGFRTGDQQQPGRVAVEPMDDAGPLGVAAGGATCGQRLRQRPGAVSGGRVHDHAGRLVDDQQVLVLPGNAKRRRLALLRRRRLLGLVDVDRLAARQDVALGPRPAVDQHAAGLDQALRPCARAQRSGEECVEPLAGGVRRGRQAHRCARSRSAGPPRRR